MLGPERLESGGERPAIREGLGPLVLGFWTRGKASRGTVARELGEEGGGSCNGSVGQVVRSSCNQRPSSKLKPGSAM